MCTDRRVHHSMDVSMRWKLGGELEGARRDSVLDGRQVLTGTAKIRFGRCSPL